MTAPLLRYAPTNRLVARGWLRSVLPAEVGVDYSLPADPTPDMRTVRFVVIEAIVGGSPDPDVPFRRPVVGLRLFVAPTFTTDQPQWNAAEQLAGSVIDAAYRHPVTAVRLDLTAFGKYRPARVHTVVPVSEPKEIRDDPGNYAGFDLDLAINWTEN